MTVATEGYANPEFEFCDRIRKIRRDVARMTQKEMARELDVSDKAYEAWESGRNKPDDIVAIAKRISMRWPGVTAGWVLGLDEQKPPPGGGGGSESLLSGTIRRPLAYLVPHPPPHLWIADRDLLTG